MKATRYMSSKERAKREGHAKKKQNAFEGAHGLLAINSTNRSATTIPYSLLPIPCLSYTGCG
jgi:hypothetical protein